MSVLAAGRTLLQGLVASEAAWNTLRRRPAVGLPLILMAGIAALLLLLQSHFVGAALRDAVAAGSPPSGDASLLPWLRLAMILAVPLGMVLRALAFGSLLHALQLAAGGGAPWRQCVSLAVLLETVALVESACTLVLLACTRPQSFEALQALQLRAGLDLFWQPGPGFRRSLAHGVNVFLLWWGWLLVQGTSRLSGLSQARSALLVLPLWLMALTLRVLLQPR